MPVVNADFDPAQTANFFTQAVQMGVPERTFDFLVDEGFGTIESLYDMTDDVMNTILQNARRPPGEVQAQIPRNHILMNVDLSKRSSSSTALMIILGLRQTTQLSSLYWKKLYATPAFILPFDHSHAQRMEGRHGLHLNRNTLVRIREEQRFVRLRRF